MRKTMKFALCAVVLGSVSACVPDDAPVFITGVHAMEGDAASCDISEAGLLRGSLDVASGQNFRGGMRLQSQVTGVSEEGSLPSSERENININDAIFDTILYDYASSPSLGLAAEREPIYGVVPAGAENPFHNIPFFGSKALEGLAGSVTGTDRVTINVGLQFEGRLRSGSGRIRTNRVVFPIVLFNSGFTGCPAGQGIALNGACGRPGGSNGAPVGCCPLDALDCMSQ